VAAGAADGLDGPRHAPAAGDQQHGVEGAGLAVEGLLHLVEERHVVGPAEGVGGKEHAEGQQLGQDEEPDRQVAGGAAAGWGGSVGQRCQCRRVRRGAALICPNFPLRSGARKRPLKFCGYRVTMPLVIILGIGNNAVLLVDDSRSVAAVIGARLAAMGHELIVAADGAEALERFRDSKPDLVLMDIEMPVMNGFEAAQQIRALEARQDWAWTPIIFLTATDTPRTWSPPSMRGRRFHRQVGAGGGARGQDEGHGAHRRPAGRAVPGQPQAGGAGQPGRADRPLQPAAMDQRLDRLWARRRQGCSLGC
jgi:CheY-like chemotaxis protein